MKNKRKILIILSIIIFLTACNDNSSSKKGKNSERQIITDNLSDLLAIRTIDFYENFYYPNLMTEQKEDFLNKFKDKGIKIDLGSLTRYNSDYNTLEKLYSYDCSNTYTKSVVYPIAPFGSKNYIIETELICNEIIKFNRYSPDESKINVPEKELVEKAVDRAISLVISNHYKEIMEERDNRETFYLTITDIINYNKDDVSNKILNMCDSDSTMIRIKPYSPFGDKDYKLDTKISLAK